MRNNKHSIAWNMAWVMVLELVLLAQSAQAQTYRVIYNFTNRSDGAQPRAGLTIDKAGNFYGTTYGQPSGCDGMNCGTVYKLSHNGFGWTLAPLYSFTGGHDGANPQARVIIGPNGSLYGTTSEGGLYGVGTVFNLRPPAHASANILGGWSETVLHQFAGGTDGAYPAYGDLIFDAAGNIYGTTEEGGGSSGYGTVFELTPSNGSWTESVLYSFTLAGGIVPFAGVLLDNAGNLYGTTWYNGYGAVGTVYELSPSGSGWAEDVLFGFKTGDGAHPMGGLIFDQSGNLYGTTTAGGSGGGGTVYELAPSNGNWTFTVLYSFTGNGNGSRAKLVMDAAGNLYGVTWGDGAYGYGSVFKLTPQPNGSWTETDLYDFKDGSDGAYPYGSVILDANGNLYGTAAFGGAYGAGVIFEITP